MTGRRRCDRRRGYHIERIYYNKNIAETRAPFTFTVQKRYTRRSRRRLVGPNRATVSTPAVGGHVRAPLSSPAKKHCLPILAAANRIADTRVATTTPVLFSIEHTRITTVFT